MNNLKPIQTKNAITGITIQHIPRMEDEEELLITKNCSYVLFIAPSLFLGDQTCMTERDERIPGTDPKKISYPFVINYQYNTGNQTSQSSRMDHYPASWEVAIIRSSANAIKGSGI